jgi:soluble lytic murein transglycosylase
MTMTACAVSALVLAFLEPQPSAQQTGSRDEPSRPFAATAAVALQPTSHPILSLDLSRLWLVPSFASTSATASLVAFAEAMKLADKESYAEALPLLTRPGVQKGVLGDYAIYYAALAELRLGRAAEACRALRTLRARPLVGYLSEATALAEAECAEALDDHAGAVEIYERLAAARPAAPDDVWMRLGGAAKVAGDTAKAREAFAKVYYDFPLSPLAPLAGTEHDTLAGVENITPLSPRYKLELDRAERLYAARQYAEARPAFEKVRASATGDERDLILLRLAQCDYYLRRLRAARDSLRPHIGEGYRQAEALYFYARVLRDLGDHATYVKTARRVADDFKDQRWAEEALNSLATHYILIDQDDDADPLFRESYARYPKGIYAERAAWKAGWSAYRRKRYAETVAFFEHAAADFPRSDYRPAWLYWSGRAHEYLGDRERAEERLMLAAADYLNSYYGRLSVERLKGKRPAARVIGEPAPGGSTPLPNEAVVRALLAARRYDDALNELRYDQRVWGDSSAIQATIAWIQRQQAEGQSGTEQFNLLRGSITTMRRAYPQFMAAGGEDLPREVLTHIFPIGYWDLILKYSAQHKLDRFLVAALMAQESTFVPAIRSSAGAVGLMQLMPATARVYARRFKLPYSSKLLTNPEANVQMGTAYLADKIEEFGSVHLALASYNAGERAVRQWQTERPGLPRDEFIDDIPYPETQTYLKRILGTADDYRRLY